MRNSAKNPLAVAAAICRFPHGVRLHQAHRGICQVSCKKLRGDALWVDATVRVGPISMPPKTNAKEGAEARKRWRLLRDQLQSLLNESLYSTTKS